MEKTHGAPTAFGATTVQEVLARATEEIERPLRSELGQSRQREQAKDSMLLEAELKAREQRAVNRAKDDRQRTKLRKAAQVAGRWTARATAILPRVAR